MAKVNLKVGKVEFQELVSINEACRTLGRGYSRTSIYRRIDSGEWIEGRHWIDDRRIGTQRRVIKINLSEVNKLRATIAGKRNLMKATN